VRVASVTVARPRQCLAMHSRDPLRCTNEFAADILRVPTRAIADATTGTCTRTLLDHARLTVANAAGLVPRVHRVFARARKCMRHSSTWAHTSWHTTLRVCTRSTTGSACRVAPKVSIAVTMMAATTAATKKNAPTRATMATRATRMAKKKRTVETTVETTVVATAKAMATAGAKSMQTEFFAPPSFGGRRLWPLGIEVRRRDRLAL